MSPLEASAPPPRRGHCLVWGRTLEQRGVSSCSRGILIETNLSARSARRPGSLAPAPSPCPPGQPSRTRRTAAAQHHAGRRCHEAASLRVPPASRVGIPRDVVRWPRPVPFLSSFLPRRGEGKPGLGPSCRRREEALPFCNADVAHAVSPLGALADQECRAVCSFGLDLDWSGGSREPLASSFVRVLHSSKADGMARLRGIPVTQPTARRHMARVLVSLHRLDSVEEYVGW